jgi:hypothetical protein
VSAVCVGASPWRVATGDRGRRDELELESPTHSHWPFPSLCHNRLRVARGFWCGVVWCAVCGGSRHAGGRARGPPMRQCQKGQRYFLREAGRWVLSRVINSFCELLLLCWLTLVGRRGLPLSLIIFFYRRDNLLLLNLFFGKQGQPYLRPTSGCDRTRTWHFGHLQRLLLMGI